MLPDLVEQGLVPFFLAHISLAMAEAMPFKTKQKMQTKDQELRMRIVDQGSQYIYFFLMPAQTCWTQQRGKEASTKANDERIWSSNILPFFKNWVIFKINMLGVHTVTQWDWWHLCSIRTQIRPPTWHSGLKGSDVATATA